MRKKLKSRSEQLINDSEFFAESEARAFDEGGTGFGVEWMADGPARGVCDFRVDEGVGSVHDSDGKIRIGPVDQGRPRQGDSILTPA